MVIGSILTVLILGYLILLCPRIIHRPDRKMFTQTRFYAHRGLHDNHSDAPENSLPAFQKAVDAGYGIELDVQLTKDRVPVVFHDDSLRRVCGVDATVDSLTYAQLLELHLFDTNEQIPTFAQVLSLVNGRVPLIVEYKMEMRHDTSVCELAGNMLDAYHGEYCIESFNPKALIYYRKHHPAVLRGQLSQVFAQHGMKKNGLMRIVFWAMAHLLLNIATAPDFIAYDCRDRLEISHLLCRKLYRTVGAAWTVKSRGELNEISNAFDVFIFEGFQP
ncbi:MAG: glycerophosphodiester phosphodiesterase [Lachnospiraceae bacterium]|nr:glycerophosphodiester phosphodiesterase [Lachnospiraceae bacterium]